jgi:hypothetical protein
MQGFLRKNVACLLAALLSSVLATTTAWAAGGAPQLSGTQLSALWIVPFAGLLLSIAILERLAPGGRSYSYYLALLILVCRRLSTS